MIVPLRHRTSGGADDVLIYVPVGQNFSRRLVTKREKPVILYVPVRLFSYNKVFKLEINKSVHIKSYKQ